MELEFELVPEEEALLRPSGRARDDPNMHPVLDPPKWAPCALVELLSYAYYLPCQLSINWWFDYYKLNIAWLNPLSTCSPPQSPYTQPSCHFLPLVHVSLEDVQIYRLEVLQVAHHWHACGHSTRDHYCHLCLHCPRMSFTVYYYRIATWLQQMLH